MFASTVRSAAATAVAVASASELATDVDRRHGCVLPRGRPGVAGQVRRRRRAARVAGRRSVRCRWSRGRRRVEHGAQREAAVGPDDVEQRRGGQARARSPGGSRQSVWTSSASTTSDSDGEVPAPHRQVERRRAARRAARAVGPLGEHDQREQRGRHGEDDQRGQHRDGERADRVGPTRRGRRRRARPGRRCQRAQRDRRPRRWPARPGRRCAARRGVAGVGVRRQHREDAAQRRARTAGRPARAAARSGPGRWSTQADHQRQAAERRAAGWSASAT